MGREASTGIRLSHDQKLVGQSSRQVAKTKRRLAETAAHLAVKEYLGQGEGQDSNHGERDPQARLCSTNEPGSISRSNPRRRRSRPRN